jgi:uncharacterized iron-regulated protein
MHVTGLTNALRANLKNKEIRIIQNKYLLNELQGAVSLSNNIVKLIFQLIKFKDIKI